MIHLLMLPARGIFLSAYKSAAFCSAAVIKTVNWPRRSTYIQNTRMHAESRSVFN